MPGKVVIVDDDRLFCKLTANCLIEAGRGVFPAPGGTDGLRLTMKVLPDVWMAGIDGYDFCRVAGRVSSAAIAIVSGAPP